MGSEVRTGRAGQSEKQVVWLQAGVDTEVPWAGYVGPRVGTHDAARTARWITERGVQVVKSIPVNAHPLFWGALSLMTHRVGGGFLCSFLAS